MNEIYKNKEFTRQFQDVLNIIKRVHATITKALNKEMR